LVDWADQIPGSVPVSPSPDIYFQIRNEANVLVVNPTTSPASRFQGEEPALHVVPEGNENASVSIALNPFFKEVPPPKGWVDIEFALDDASMMVVGLGVDSPATESIAAKPDYLGRLLCTVFLCADRPAILRDEVNPDSPRPEMKPPITSMDPHVLRIEWDWTKNSGLRFFLDGEPLIGGDGELVFLPVPTETLNEGVDALSIFVHAGAFLRKITASE